MEAKLLKDDSLIELNALCYNDLKVFCATLFPEIFSAEFSALHQEIFNLINAGHKKIAIAAPRGIGKTSIAKAMAMRAILYRTASFIVYLSNSATSAEMQTENMKRDLLLNPQVQHMFGNIKKAIGEDFGMDETFSKAAWTAYGSTFILPRGAGQQVRGLNWASHRPELVIIDDLENKNEIRSQENRDKLKEWFWSDLMKTEDRYGDGCIFIYIDTIKHEDCLLIDLMESPDWASVQLSICDQNYKSLDTNYMTDKEIMVEVNEHRRLGTLDAFYMERMNIPIAAEDAIFKPEYFKYFEDRGDKLIITDEEGKKEEILTRNLIHVTIVDPAKTVKIQNAETAVLTLAVDRTSKKIFYREIVSKRMFPDDIYTEAFRQVRVFNSMILGYEITGLNEFIIQPFKNQMRQENLHPILLELTAKRGVNEKGKIERIRTLAPHYRLGYMYHNKTNCGALEQQLLGFPKSKLWDVMDAAAYITHIMDKQAIFFDPTDEIDEMPEEDEYDDLDCEAAMDEWEMGAVI